MIANHFQALAPESFGDSAALVATTPHYLDLPRPSLSAPSNAPTREPPNLNAAQATALNRSARVFQPPGIHYTPVTQ